MFYLYFFYFVDREPVTNRLLLLTQWRRVYYNRGIVSTFTNPTLDEGNARIRRLDQRKRQNQAQSQIGEIDNKKQARKKPDHFL